MAEGNLEKSFANPPDSAKPQTWWHWMNGNISKEGITADLEAMKHIGLGGATIVNVDCSIPRGDVPFMSPEWREDFKFAVQEANRLDLKLCVENCAGWSSSGGPWNTVTNAMQRVTTSEVRVSGPTSFSAVLPQPPTTLGFYRDIAVLAFPAPADEGVHMIDFSPIASASGNEQPGDKLTDGDNKTFIRLPVPKRDQPQFAQLEFQKPFSARMVKIVGGKGMPQCSGEILVSDDGNKFRTLKSFSFPRKGAPLSIVSLGARPVAARFWRVQFNAISAKVMATATNIPLAEIDLAPRLTIDNVNAKDGLNGGFVLSSPVTDDAVEGTIRRKNVIDLTAKLTTDGKLNWHVPSGEWMILRVGYTPTGVNNHPAPAEGTGLECDKLSKTALDAHWDGFMQKILDDLGPLAGKTLDSSLIDSYEVGGQNWTKDFRKEFQKRRGYDPLKFLPAFTGRVVDNPAVSERFLWDVRRTIADLFAENYFGHFAELCRQHGLMNAVEPYTGPFESMQSGATADVVMGEFWSGSQGHPSVKLVASIAHTYGKTIVGAESFTAGPENGRWQNDPYSLKTLGDLMYCQGLNRYVFHRFAMQPWTNRWPGMTMGQWGFHFERTETWWNQGKPWIDYITHCQFLLQQGRAVADAAYFTGESTPVEMREGNPALPAGYDYDAVNTDVLLHGATVENGRIVLASGANYAALILPPDDVNMTPQMLQRILDLVRAGATVIGPRPQHSPSLADFPKCDAQVKKLAGKLWGKCDGTNIFENPVGKGHVIWGKSLAEVFAAQNLKPDFEFQNEARTTQLAYAHRIAGEMDIYFVSNQRRQFDSAECTFRVNGKVPELWHPDTGLIEPAPVWSAQAGRTKVRLNFDPAGSVFVIFRHAADNTDHVVAVSDSSAAERATPPKLEIQHAVYAVTGGAGEMDVTAKLSELARDCQLAVAVSNDFFGRDPAAGHVKELRVDYTLDGKPGHAVVQENEKLTLPATMALGQSPLWETGVAAGGGPVVKAWGNGVVELRMAGGNILHAIAVDVPQPQEISGEWNLSFPPNCGAPQAVTLGKLISWTDHTNDGVRYFSGTATYEKEIKISAGQLAAGRELWLDLGAVKNFAEVFLNGQNLGVLWKPPFCANITAAAKPGANKLVIKVTNLWPNRLIGDEQLPPDCEWNGKELKAWPQWLLDGKPSPTGRLTFTTWHHWTKDAPLLESGLLGSVTLRTAELVGWAVSDGADIVPTTNVVTYADGRPTAKYRLDAEDAGVVLHHGDGPGECDYLGARDVWVWEDHGTYYMHYDAAGPKGWLACLATSTDLVHWEKKGPVLNFGSPGSGDSASASYGTTYFDGKRWHMFYLGTPHATSSPDFIPSFPYLTMKAVSALPTGPWVKQPAVSPFRPQPGTYYSSTASPGQIIKLGGEYLMFFSASMKRTIGIARAKDLNGAWAIDANPIVPSEEQVENSSFYYEPATQTWFLFTNHIGIENGNEFTDAVWVYWTKDLNRWNAVDKAVVLDGGNCRWSHKCVGLPSVVKVGNRLAILYDAPGDDSTSHMKRDVGLAWLNLPLHLPTDTKPAEPQVKSAN